MSAPPSGRIAVCTPSHSVSIHGILSATNSIDKQRQRRIDHGVVIEDLELFGQRHPSVARGKPQDADRSVEVDARGHGEAERPPERQEKVHSRYDGRRGLATPSRLQAT